MSAVLENRVGRLEGEANKNAEKVSGIEITLAEVRADLRWIKWLLMVVAPASVLHLVLGVIAFAIR